MEAFLLHLINLFRFSKLYIRRGEIGKSLDLAKQSLTLFEELEDAKGVGNTLSSIGSSYGSLGDTAKINQQTDLAVSYYNQAIDFYKKEHVDLILMDVHMPEMDGLEATQCIRDIECETRPSSPVPIIALTASLMESEIEKCFEAGNSAYIGKPYQISDLIGEIHKSISKQEG